MPELNNTILKNSANLQGYWRLESNGNDSGPNGYNLTGTSPTYTTALFGNGGDFESSSSQYLSASAANCRIAGSQSFSAWVKVESLPVATQSRIIGVSDSTPTNYVALTLMDTGKYAFQVSGLTATQILSDVDAVIGTWTHVVGVYNSSTSKLFVYVNALAKELAVTGSHTAGSGNLAIGRLGDYTSASTYFDGFIDDVAVFDIALSADQVKELYEGRYIGELQPQAGLVALYHLSSTTDYSGNHYTLTNNNTVAFNAGKFSNAMDLGTSNTNKYLSIANDMGITSGACSVTLWVKITTEPSSASFAIFERGDSGVHVRHWVRYIDTAGTKTLQFNRQRENAANDQFAPTITALGTSIYHHIAYAYDGTTLVGYLDGVAIGSVASSGNGISGVASDYLYLGHSLHATTLYCDAIIDEVGVWNKNLTAVEVRKMYAVGKGRYL